MQKIFRIAFPAAALVVSLFVVFSNGQTPTPARQIKGTPPVKKLSPKQEWVKPTVDESNELIRTDLAVAPKVETEAHKLFVKGVVLAKAKKYDEALAAVMEAEALEPKLFEIHLAKGALLADLKRLPDAASAFAKAVAIDPRNAQARGFLCRALAETGKRSEAIDECREAVRLDPNDTRSSAFLSRLYISRDRLIEALQLLELAYRRPQNDIGVFGTLADLYLDSGEYSRTAELYERIAALWPQVSLTYGRLIVYGYLGRLTDAVASARKLAELEPKKTFAQMNLGYTLQNAGFFDESIPPLLQATALDPANGEAYLMLSESYDVIGDKAGRVSSLGHAYRYLPPSFELAYMYGRALDSAGRSKDAVAPYERALGLIPDDVDAMAKLGSTYAEVFRYDEAIALLTKALSSRPTDQFIPMMLNVSKGRKYLTENFEQVRKNSESNPKDCQARQTLAEAYRFSGKLLDAEREYLALIVCATNNYEVHNTVSVFYNETGQMDKSNIHLQKAIDLKPHYVLYSVLSMNLADAGKLDDAIVAGRKAIEIKPDYIYGYVQLADLLAKKGNPDEALAGYQKAFDLNSSGLQPNFRLAWFFIRTGNREGAFRHYNILRSLAPSQLKYLERSLRAHFPAAR